MVEDASSSAVGDAGEHITACENKSSEVVTITQGNRRKAPVRKNQLLQLLLISAARVE